MIHLTGAGLGLRRVFLDNFIALSPANVDFVEIAPENWMQIGGALAEKLEQVAQSRPVVLHGLSLSLGGPQDLDLSLLHQVKDFMQQYQISLYTEHLSYCSDQGQLYDLMPIPFTEAAIEHVVERIKQVQDITGKAFAIENISYYAAPHPAHVTRIPEIDFINTILEKSDAQLLLDINNIYVNSVNHGYDPVSFLSQLPTSRICYCHIAGHYQEANDLIIDTHGEAVIDPVWKLLEKTYAIHGLLPTLLERDLNIPPLAELLQEVDRIHTCQQPFLVQHHVA